MRQVMKRLGLGFTLAIGLIAANAPDANASLLVSSTSGVGQFTGYIGQSVTTPGSSASYNNITFNFFDTSNSAAAPGTLFILNQATTDTPTTLGVGSAGYLAQSISNAGGIYSFAPSVSLSANTQYFFYENVSFTSTGSPSDPYPGGFVLTASSATSQYIGFVGSDANFQLSGNFSTAAAVPEPSSMIMAGTAVLLGTYHVRRRKQAVAKSLLP